MTSRSTMRVAALSDNGLILYDYQDKTYEYNTQTSGVDVWNLKDLYDLARSFDVDTLWITPGSQISHNAKTLCEQREEMTVLGSQKRDTTPRFLMIWLGNIDSVKVAWPEWDDRWPWKKCTDARTLLKTILYLQDAMECEIAWSPGHVGQSLMLQLNEDRPEWIRDAVLPAVVKENLALDMQWKRPLTTEENREGLYFHLFDKNSMYSAACTSAQLGEGSPVHVEKFDLFNPRTAGLWRVGKDWMWTPELELLLAEYPEKRLAVGESYQWPTSHTTLRSWGEHMWGGRRELRGPDISGHPYIDHDARSLAYRAAKPIANQGLGWLAMESKRGDNKLYRPDWWSMVVSTARRNMGFKIRQLTAQGMTPVYCNVDALGLVSDSPSLEQYHKHLLHRKDALGGFKHVKTIPFRGNIRELFNEDVSFRDCQNGIVAAVALEDSLCK